jgi:hypothetical protein
VNPVRQAIYTRLSADSTLTALLSSAGAIYHQVAPQTAQTPFIVFHKQSGVPTWQFAGAHIQGDVWTVKAVDRSSSASRAEDISARADVVLTDAPLAVTGNDLLAVYRESDIDYPESVDGETYRHVGFLARLVTAPA